MTKLTDRHIDMMICDLEDWGGMIPPNRDAVRAIVEKDTNFVNTILEIYPTATKEFGLDTAERDTLLYLVANHFTGRDWPRNMERNKESLDKFFNDLRTNGEAQMWGVNIATSD